MKHFIDPTVDVVFAKIFGSKHNKPTLIHFLNSMLNLEKPIVDVTLTNIVIPTKPLNLDKAVINILASDEVNSVYQIDLQTTTPTDLANRALANWSINLGESATSSPPNTVISIWVLNGAMHPPTESHHVILGMHEKTYGFKLSNDCIHILQLDKWVKPETLQLEDQWFYALKEGKHWQELPEALRGNKAFETVMDTLNLFSEDEWENNLYCLHESYRRIQIRDEAAQTSQNPRVMSTT